MGDHSIIEARNGPIKIHVRQIDVGHPQCVRIVERTARTVLNESIRKRWKMRSAISSNLRCLPRPAGGNRAIQHGSLHQVGESPSQPTRNHPRGFAGGRARSLARPLKRAIRSGYQKCAMIALGGPDLPLITFVEINTSTFLRAHLPCARAAMVSMYAGLLRNSPAANVP